MDTLYIWQTFNKSLFKRSRLTLDAIHQVAYLFCSIHLLVYVITASSATHLLLHNLCIRGYFIHVYRMYLIKTKHDIIIPLKYWL